MKNSTKSSNSLQEIHPNTAGIDVGSGSHFVAVPPGRDPKPVREFPSFTVDLHRIVKWLKKCHIEKVAIESTGVYWIPLYEILEDNGFDVCLVNAKHIKNAPGRKTDVQDSQWLQQLHAYGLLQKSFRPTQTIVELRTFCRQRTGLIENASAYVLRMQKVLTEMNIQLNNVISDITGVTGMKIIKAIISGERSPKALARLRHARCRNPQEVIMKSLEGNYRDEHVFSLKQNLQIFQFHNAKISECEKEIEIRLQQIEAQIVPPKFPGVPGINHRSTTEVISRPKAPKKLRKHEFGFDLETHLERITGVNLAKIPGMTESSALLVISEIGLGITQWKNSKHFASWLGLCPKNKISGGKILSSRTRPGSKRVAWILRLCATSLHNSKSALGAHLRRLKSRLGAPKAITALAHKLAKMLYNMLRYGTEYVEKGQDDYERRHKERSIKNLMKNAARLGFAVSPTSQAPASGT